MDKQELIEYFGKFLNLGKSEQPTAFRIFTRKLRDILGANDALRIPELGIFQLKKEPTPRAERGEGEAEQSVSQALVFSPPLEDLSSRSKALFQTIEINELDKESEVFNEKVFSLGFDQPLVPIGDNAGEGHTPGLSEQDLEEKIEAVIAKSELLHNFDLWTDYLGEKEESADATGDETEVKENALGISEESIETELDIDDAETEATESDQSSEETEDVDWDWSDELQDAIEGGKTEKPEDEIDLVVEDPFDSLTPVVDDSEMNNHETELQAGEPETETKEDEIERKDSIDNENAEDLSPGTTEPEPKKEEDNEETQPATVSGDTEIAPMFEHSHGDEPVIEESTEPEKKSYSKYIWSIAGLALLIVIYFGYFSGDTTVDLPEEENPAMVDSGNSGETFSAVPIDSNKHPEIKAQTNIEPDNSSDEDQIEAQNRAQKIKSITKPPVSSKRVGNLIFQDGNTFSVQVASYRTRESAQRHVDRLRQSGFDAFVAEAFIEKYNSTWYRVRIGGFSTKEEAQNFKVN